MLQMAANGAVVSYSGGPPGRVREANAFDWIFEDPFQQENDYTSSERRLAKIEGDRPIFVDNKTGKTIDSSSLDYSYDPPSWPPSGEPHPTSCVSAVRTDDESQ